MLVWRLNVVANSIVVAKFHYLDTLDFKLAFSNRIVMLCYRIDSVVRHYRRRRFKTILQLECAVGIVQTGGEIQLTCPLCRYIPFEYEIISLHSKKTCVLIVNVSTWWCI